MSRNIYVWIIKPIKMGIMGIYITGHFLIRVEKLLRLNCCVMNNIQLLFL